MMSLAVRVLFLLHTALALLPIAAYADGVADFAGLVDIGNGRKMYLVCRGEGSPTVVLVSGKGDRADTWSTPSPYVQGPTVLSAIAKLTRVCAYDRPGTVGALSSDLSRSDPVPLPVTAAAGAADLQVLLQVAKVPGPYILVGHSMGGLIARLIASEHRDEIAGLVLEDALSEDLYNGLTTEQRAVFEKLNGAPENYDNLKSFAQVRAAAAPVPPMPVVVLTAGRPQLTPEIIASGQLPPDVTQSFADTLWKAQMLAQDKLARFFPGARHIIVENSTHYVHIEQPQVVIDAIRDVVDTVRQGKTTLAR